jgi:hypothetical protein
VAREAGAFVDPHPLSRVEREARAAFAAAAIEAHQPSRLRDEPSQRRVVEIDGLRPG